MPVEILTQVVGATFIALYSYHRFNTPYTNRSCTTAFRYHVGAAVYALLVVTAYLALTSVQLSDRVQDLLSANQTEFLRDPLLLALLMTVLLPQAPWLATADEWLRDKCKRIAAIPYEVRRLSAELRRSPFELSDETWEAVRRRLLERGFREEDVQLGDENRPRGLWIKATALMIQVQDWESDPRFAGFLNRFADEWQRLRAEFSALVPKARRCFQLLSDAAGAPQDLTIGKLADEYQASLMDEVGRLIKELFGFISRGVLQCKLTQATRIQQLSKLGFQRRTQPPTLSRDSLVAVFLMVLPVIGASLLYNSNSELTFAQVLTRAPQYALTYVVAVICALFARRNFRRPAVDTAPVGVQRYWSTYLLAGVAAVAASTSISLVSRSLQNITDVSLNALLASYFERGLPWVLMAFVTAFVTAFHLDNRASDRVPIRRLRWIEGAAQGLVTLMAAQAVRLWLAELGHPIGWHVLVSSTLIGFLLGATVPSWFRIAPEGDLEHDEPIPIDPILAPAGG